MLALDRRTEPRLAAVPSEEAATALAIALDAQASNAAFLHAARKIAQMAQARVAAIDAFARQAFITFDA